MAPGAREEEVVAGGPRQCAQNTLVGEPHTAGVRFSLLVDLGSCVGVPGEKWLRKLLKAL